MVVAMIVMAMMVIASLFVFFRAKAPQRLVARTLIADVHAPDDPI